MSQASQEIPHTTYLGWEIFLIFTHEGNYVKKTQYTCKIMHKNIHIKMNLLNILSKILSVLIEVGSTYTAIIMFYLYPT